MTHARDLVIAVRRALGSPKSVAAALGLKVQEVKPSYVMALCPVHAERTASCSIHRRGESIGVKCWGCKWTADLIGLVAAVHGIDARSDYREALAIAAELANMPGEADALRGRRPEPARRAPVAPLEPEPERDYPLPREVNLLWGACVPVTDDTEVSAMLEARGIGPKSAAREARALAKNTHWTSLPGWARFKGKAERSRPWTETGHRLILPVYDSDGGMRSVRAWLVTGDPGMPKRVPPAGHRASGVVTANWRAAAMLRGETSPSRTVIVEGEPDFLARSILNPDDAVMGVMSGSWHEGFAARIPFGSEVIVRTHVDRAGEAYAEEIIKSLANRAWVSRLEAEAEDAA
jgi:hypothetical protein